jgi:hypothetical protein
MTLMRDLPEAEISYTAADRPREKVEFATQDLTVVIHAKVSRYVVLIPDSAGGPHIRVLDGNVSH